MSKIRVVLTGGTIGSQSGGGVLDVGAMPDRLPWDVGPSQGITWELCAPLYALSENIGPSDWPRVIDAALSGGTDDINGIIVTHGTDTLPFTAAALSFAMRHIRIPVVLVSAALPFACPGSNGPAHWRAAVDFILHVRLPGVYVVYQNPGEDAPSFHLATRLLPCDPLTHCFASAGNPPIGMMKDGLFRPAPGTRELFDRITACSGPPPVDPPRFSSDVLYLTPYPGLDYGRISLNGVCAVLHGLYHSGTASVAGETTSLAYFVEMCARRGIPAFALSPLKTGEDYRSTRILREAGLIFLPPMTMPAALVKLMLILGAGGDRADVRREMELEFWFEFL